jgi:hypothetical protein
LFIVFDNFVFGNNLDPSQVTQNLLLKSEVGTQLHQASEEARDHEALSIIDICLVLEDVSPRLQRMNGLFAKTLKGSGM